MLPITKALVTRYGGAGDMIMMEPALEALYYKLRPMELYLRTHPHYQDLHKFHPLITKIVPGILTANASAPGFPSDEKKPQGFDFFYNTTGSIEMNRGIHGIDSFAFALSATPIRRTPVLYLDPTISINETDIVVHTPKRSQMPPSPRNVDFCIEDIPERITKHLASKGIKHKPIVSIGHEEERENGLQAFSSIVAGARLFVGPDSAGTHIAAALSVPKIAAAYTPTFPEGIRAYPNVVATRDQDIEGLLYTVEKFYNAPDREISDGTAPLAVLSSKYAYGNILNYEGIINGGPYDLIRVPPGFFANSNWRKTLWEFKERLSPEGVLFFYEEHPKYTNQDIDPVLIVKFLMDNVRLDVIEYSATADRYGCFFIAAKGRLCQ